MNEEWKDIDDRYRISNMGRIWSTKKGRLLNPFIEKNGYKCIDLYYGTSASRQCKKIHRLVAEAFIPNPDSLPFIDHIDEDKTNAVYMNLRWCTPRQNVSWANEGKHTSNHAGVSWAKRENRWRSVIKVNGKTKHIGYFDNELDASKAYQDRLREIIQ